MPHKKLIIGFLRSSGRPFSFVEEFLPSRPWARQRSALEREKRKMKKKMKKVSCPVGRTKVRGLGCRLSSSIGQCPDACSARLIAWFVANRLSQLSSTASSSSSSSSQLPARLANNDSLTSARVIYGRVRAAGTYGPLGHVWRDAGGFHCMTARSQILCWLKYWSFVHQKNLKKKMFIDILF